MSHTISAPSKTFILGEYAALEGLPALLLNTEPRFRLEVTAAQQPNLSYSGIEPLSPAGRFLQDHKSICSTYQLVFHDPHDKQGGFGASSAQFLMIYRLVKYGLAQTPVVNIEDLLDCYKHYSWNGQGLAPSGADVVSQLTGKLTWFAKQELTADSHDWPFTELQAVLIRTGHKLATHSHLTQLNTIPYSAFKAILQQAKLALQTKDPAAFIYTIKLFANELMQAGLVTVTTAELLTKLDSLPYLLAAKGCGAMGADVIFALVAKSDRPKLSQWLTAQQLDHWPAIVSPGWQLTRA